MHIIRVSSLFIGSYERFGAVTVSKASDFHGVSMASLHQHLLSHIKTRGGERRSLLAPSGDSLVSPCQPPPGRSLGQTSCPIRSPAGSGLDWTELKVQTLNTAFHVDPAIYGEINGSDLSCKT